MISIDRKITPSTRVWRHFGICLFTSVPRESALTCIKKSKFVTRFENILFSPLHKDGSHMYHFG